MRIVHVAPTSFGGAGIFGGGERYPLELTRALSRLVDCRLVVFGRDSGDHVDSTGLRIRVLRPVGHLRGHPAHPVATGIRTAIRGTDVVHIHQLWSAPAQVATLMGRACGQRVVATDHGLHSSGLGRLMPRLVDRVLAVSRHSADLLNAPAAKTTIVYGGCDPERFRPEPGEWRDGVVFVGRFTPHKGLDRLLRALPDRARLTCVGTFGHDRDGPERGYPTLLRRLADGRNVAFAEAVTDAELPLILRRARVAVLPSVTTTCYGRRIAVSELLGLAVIEAMASGTPVVCSRVGGLPEVVDDGETGYLVPPGDVEALHDRIASLISDPATAERMGRNARQAVLDRLTWTACAKRCLEAYAELAAGPA